MVGKKKKYIFWCVWNLKKIQQKRIFPQYFFFDIWTQRKSEKKIIINIFSVLFSLYTLFLLNIFSFLTLSLALNFSLQLSTRLYMLLKKRLIHISNLSIEKSGNFPKLIKIVITTNQSLQVLKRMTCATARYSN